MDKIIDSIYLGIISGYRNSTDISILTGSSGKILFLGYHYNSTCNKEILSKLEEIIAYTIDLINNNDFKHQDFTYGGGITGFYWVINHLYRKNLLFKDSAALKNILNNKTEHSIVESLEMDFLLSRYDPLYGYLGKGLYFLSKPESALSKSVIEKILQILSRDRVQVDVESITWVDFRLKYEYDDAKNERFVLGNCGQAHGITGIISFLCTVLEKYNSKRIKNIAAGLLRPAVNWLLAQEIPVSERDFYYFPQSVNLLNRGGERASKFSRLGWCYGDHIIAYTLYRVAIVLNEEKYRSKADEVTLNSCRIPLERSGVTAQAEQKQFDPTICHGAAGIAHIYQRIYHYNKSPQVAEACTFWKEITRDYTESYLNTGKLLNLSDKSQEAFDLLYGYAGIGLHLIADVYSNYGWDSCILLE